MEIGSAAKSPPLLRGFMNKRWIGTFALAFSLAAFGQEKQDDEIKLTFNFRNARIEDVLDYVAKVSGWKFVWDKVDKAKIDELRNFPLTAVSDGAVSGEQALVILDTALRQHGLATVNPYAPRLPRKGETLKIVKAEDAAGMTLEVHFGADPDKIAPTDKMITQIISLKGANVVDVQKELKETIDKTLGSEGKWSISTYSNSLILTGRSENIRRVALILQVIDVKAADKLETKVYPLKNADATETTKVLSEIFKKETQAAERDASPFGRMFEMFGGRRNQGEQQGPTAKSVASQIVRIVADTRTNSVVCVATEENMKTIHTLIEQLDAKSVEIIKLKCYPLQYGDATEVAKVVTEIFSEQGSSSSQSQRRQGNPFRPFFLGPQQQQPESPASSSREVRAVADTRTNSVLIAASEKNLGLIDDLVRSMDRQVNDMLMVKIYELRNGDAKEMASVLRELFRPQVNATQQSGRSTQQQGGRNQFMQMMGMQGGGSGSGGLPPNQEVEITSDSRTNSVIVKASPEYIKIMDTVIDQLDRNATESVSTYTIRLRNADASSVAQVLQNLLRGSGSSSSTNRSNTQSGPFGGMNLNTNQGSQTRGNNQQGSTRSGNNQSSTRRGGNLGPLEVQDETTPLLQDEEERRRGIEGQVDVQSDQNTNSLVIRTSPRNYKAIEGIVQELDRLRPQVLIKVLIADVTLTDNMQFGVEGSIFNQDFSYGAHNNRQSFGTDFGLASNGFTYSLSGDDISAKLNAMATNGTLKILATPRILVLDNQSANINIGKEVPVVSNTQVNQLGNTVNTVRYENVGILLQVTPHINPDGLVTMVVHPEVSDIASAAESVKITEGVNSPTFIVNSADTTVAVRNGQTVVIGGLIRETIDESTDGIPILKDIPLLGLLFSSTTKKKSKRELMIFLTPYVAYTTMELEELTELEKSKLKLMDQKDIEAESDKWLERVRR